MPAAPARRSSSPARSAPISSPLHALRELARDREAEAGALRRSLEVKNGSKMWGMFWRLMPRPESETSRRTCPFSRGGRNDDTGARGRVHAARCRAGYEAPAPPAPGRTRSRSARRRARARTLGVVLRGRRRELAGDLARQLADVGRLGRSSSAPASSRERSSSSVASLRMPLDLRRAAGRGTGARVSSSRSSSASSSRKPPSEKIGVRSSCEADAMNCLRARSSRASWCCMSSKAAASWPSSSSESGSDRVARSRPPRPCARPARAARRAATARAPRGSRRAPRSRARSPPESRIWRRISDTLSCDVVERVGEHRDAARRSPPSISGSADERLAAEPASARSARAGRRVASAASGDRLHVVESRPPPGSESASTNSDGARRAADDAEHVTSALGARRDGPSTWRVELLAAARRSRRSWRSSGARVAARRRSREAVELLVAQPVLAAAASTAR